MRRLAIAFALVFGSAAAQGAQPATDALALHQRLLVLDSHLDTPRLLSLPGWDIRKRHDSRRDLSQVDLPRLREGGLDGAFWAIYTPQGPRDSAGRHAASTLGLATLQRIRDLIERHPRDFGLALNAADARRLQGEGRHAVFISMENAQPLASDPALLATYQRQGLRMLGLVHGSNNDLADSATALPEWGGLSPTGQALVAQANCLGILLDASHASDQVFDQLLERSLAPIVLSHSSSRAVNPHPRNLDDARIRRLAEHGGVIQVTLYGDYLQSEVPDPRRQSALQPLYGRLRQMAGLSPDEFAELAREVAEVERRYPRPRASLDDFMAHLLHVIEVAGVEHVGIGGDWDGGGGVEGLEDVAGLPRITERLLQAGYDETQIAGIWGGNLLRLLDEVQARARTHCTP